MQAAQFKLIEQGEFIFLNFNFKGYSKSEGVRYALSENEILLEVADFSTGIRHRLCQTLFKEIDVDQSSVELLVDYVVIKLCKAAKKAKWDQSGYDIKEFTNPEKGRMKSNFLNPIIVK